MPESANPTNALRPQPGQHGREKDCTSAPRASGLPPPAATLIHPSIAYAFGLFYRLICRREMRAWVPCLRDASQSWVARGHTRWFGGRCAPRARSAVSRGLMSISGEPVVGSELMCAGLHVGTTLLHRTEKGGSPDITRAEPVGPDPRGIGTGRWIRTGWRLHPARLPAEPGSHAGYGIVVRFRPGLDTHHQKQTAKSYHLKCGLLFGMIDPSVMVQPVPGQTVTTKSCRC